VNVCKKMGKWKQLHRNWSMRTSNGE
jgi:hypothetical protein